MNDVWNKYEKINKISTSSYGSIIKAKDKHTGKYVAIKELKKSKYENIKEFLSNENIMELNKLENSVDIIETFDINDSFYIIIRMIFFCCITTIFFHNKHFFIRFIYQAIYSTYKRSNIFIWKQ